MRTMRRICRKRMLRRADVAKMLPCVPAAITASDATNTMKSDDKECAKGKRKLKGATKRGFPQDSPRGFLTDDAEGLAGETQPSLPAAISATAARCPDPDEVLQAKHHNHHKLLRHKNKMKLNYFYSNVSQKHKVKKHRAKACGETILKRKTSNWI